VLICAIVQHWPKFIGPGTESFKGTLTSILHLDISFFMAVKQELVQWNG